MNSLSVSEMLCGKPADGDNTVPVSASASMSFMDVYEYRCLAGYKTTDKLASVCQADGTFSIAPPVCTLLGNVELWFSTQKSLSFEITF